MERYLIINADDFGYSQENNEAIKLGYQNGTITSCSLLTNLNGFEIVVFTILPEINEIDLGFHFNIVEGKSITKNRSYYLSSNGSFYS